MDRQDELAALGYQVIDASNPVVKVAWIVRCPGMEDRVLVAASEAEGWSLAAEHAGRRDELAVLIAEAPGGSWDNFRPDQQEMFRMAAAAVRSFMGSEEAVDRVAAAIVKKADGCDWANMTERARNCEREFARAALSALIGEDIGGGRG